MSKFKVGDTVRIAKPNNCKKKGKYINKTYKIIEDETCLGDSEQWWKLNDDGYWRWSESELESVENPIKATNIKIDSSGIEIAAKPLKITVDDLKTISDYETEFNNQLYEQFVLGKFNKKEGNEMIESMILIDLYASKYKESIEKETREKVEELRKNCDVINKYNELVEQFKKDCDELYLSQFTEEEKMDIIADKQIGDADKQLQRSYRTWDKYKVNKCFNPEGYKELMNEQQEKINDVNDLVKTVKAHVGIAKTKEEVEEILNRYGIIDKKGKLVI